MVTKVTRRNTKYTGKILSELSASLVPELVEAS